MKTKGKIFAWLAFFNYAHAGLGFLINIWIANRLGAEGYGMVAYAIVLSSFVATLTNFASDRTLVRDLVQSEKPHATMAASMALRLVVALCIGVVLFGWLCTGAAQEKTWPVFLCALWGMLQALQPTAWFDSRYEMHIHAGITLLERILYCVVVFCLLTGFPALGKAPVMVAGAMFFSRLLAITGQWKWVLRSFRPSWQGLGGNITWLVRENLPILFAALSNMLMTHVNQLILERRQTIAVLAQYAVAMQLIGIVIIFQAQIVRLLTPRIAEICKNGIGMRRGLLKYSALSALDTMVLIIPLVWLAPWIVEICFRPEYADAVKPLRILACWCMLYGPALVLNQFLISLRLNRSYLVISLLSGCLAVILSAQWAKSMGASGAACALLVSHALSIVLQFILVWRRMGSTGRRGDGTNPLASLLPDQAPMAV